MFSAQFTRASENLEKFSMIAITAMNSMHTMEDFGKAVHCYPRRLSLSRQGHVSDPILNSRKHQGVWLTNWISREKIGGQAHEVNWHDEENELWARILYSLDCTDMAEMNESSAGSDNIHVTCFSIPRLLKKISENEFQIVLDAVH